MSIKVSAIISRLPPDINGVGDYAVALARQLRRDHNIETEFIVCDKNWKGTDQIDNFPVKQLKTQSADSLFSVLSNRNLVLLHYVNYAYAKRGCPFWLNDGLKQWKRTFTQHRLVTFFHELYAFGPLWTSSFWLSPIQRRLAAELARMSDLTITSMSKYANKLSSWGVDVYANMPVFSNVGEPSKLIPISNRVRRMVIFGGKGNRLRVYKENIDNLYAACRQLSVKEIYDIGPHLDIAIPQLDDVRVIAVGPKPAQHVSSILLDSMFGVIDYFPGYMAKSGIFAAYCAHGVVPVCLRHNPSEADGINQGEHYLIIEKPLQGFTVENLQVVSDTVYNWYGEHNIKAQAIVFASALAGFYDNN